MQFATNPASKPDLVIVFTRKYSCECAAPEEPLASVGCPSPEDS